jgi:hypothetical protein|tara:strand:- start:5172 stop:5351 length:180 start_codon:yes stop_codon:yes gene_type:complete
MSDNVTPVKEFWERKVLRLKNLYTYGEISEEKFEKEMITLGFTYEQIANMYIEDEDDEE